MNHTVTAKIRIYPTEEQVILLRETLEQYRKGCQFVSDLIFKTKEKNKRALHLQTYRPLREQFGLKSQMAQSVLKTVISKYKTISSNQHEWTLVQFNKPQVDLVWNRDYSLKKGVFSVNTLQGRILIPFETKGMAQYFNDEWTFGTAKCMYKHGKWFLHIPVTKDIPDCSLEDIDQIVGIDVGINFLATAYDSHGKTTFFSGRAIKQQRAKYKHLRKQLQQCQTPSARKKLKTIGQRENRWMTDINHQVSKALVEKYGSNTLFVLEDLTGIRHATEKVHHKNRYMTVSWAFYQFREMLTYKAQGNQSKVIAVSPKYTSQTCPICGHVSKTNRNKKLHLFICKQCHYTSNDDRIGAMNLQHKGIEYMVAVTKGA